MVLIIQSKKFLLRNLGFEFKLYLVKQIPENTDRVVSGLKLTSVLLRNLEFKILSCIWWNRYLRIQIELYPDWYWLVYYCGLSSKNTAILQCTLYIAEFHLKKNYVLYIKYLNERFLMSSSYSPVLWVPLYNIPLLYSVILYIYDNVRL